ncbi:hypothetical protein RhiirA4_427679 [Rhizophagus irregularis]|uniref:Uncharacterized protein n=1 Tax=Rhizophagus irregularis TaxID=588596 RepID=A0A2I1H9Y4_9GLOM|nr:hypothetical protein RhiirA4_427679 [Rhizophagus irregularis]
MILNSSKTIVDRVEDFVLNSSFEILNPTSVAFKAIGDGPLKKETVIKELVEIAIYAAMENLMMDIKLFIHFKRLGAGLALFMKINALRFKMRLRRHQVNEGKPYEFNIIDINTVTWEDPLSSQIIDDESNIFKKLFLSHAEKMKPEIFSSINDLCQQLKASDDYNALDDDDNVY